jgi:hypothetical protein
VTTEDPKYKEILQNFTSPPVTNIIGSGVRKKRGSGIKKF